MSDDIYCLPECAACPTCSAEANAPCLTPSREVVERPHVERGIPRSLGPKFVAVWRRKHNSVINRPLTDVVMDRPMSVAPKSCTMTPDKNIDYLKRWRNIEDQRKTLDYEVSRC